MSRAAGTSGHALTHLCEHQEHVRRPQILVLSAWNAPYNTHDLGAGIYKHVFIVDEWATIGFVRGPTYDQQEYLMYNKQNERLY